MDRISKKNGVRELKEILSQMILLGEAERVSDEGFEEFEPVPVNGAPVSETIVEDRKDRF